MPRPAKQERIGPHLCAIHRNALVAYAASIVGGTAQAEDVVQEACIRLNNTPNPDFVREPLNYLYRVVRNLAIDSLRSLSREIARDAGPAEAAASGIADRQPDAEQALAATEELTIVLEALAELPERTRIAVRMSRMEGYKLREVAEHLGLSLPGVHKLITEALIHCDRRRSAALSENGMTERSEKP